MQRDRNLRRHAQPVARGGRYSILNPVQFTVCTSTGEVLVTKLELPPYTTVI